MSDKTANKEPVSINNLPDFLTIQQVADMFQISKAAVTRLINTGNIKAFKLPGSSLWRIPAQEIHRLLVDNI